MDINPIETRYAGCRFRSRLEARWAVFFDHLKIEWEYEPQGMKIPNRAEGGEWAYLPDFWLSGGPWSNEGEGVYAEVKGSADMMTAEYRKMLAFGVDWGGPLSRGLLLLGPIPDITRASRVYHQVLRNEKGIVLQYAFFRPGLVVIRSTSNDFGFPGEGEYSDCYADEDLPDGISFEAETVRITSASQASRWWPLRREVKEAYEAARSARFEHGECG